MSKKNFTELYFEWWLIELKNKGMIIDFKREPETFILREPLKIEYNQHFKTKDALIREFNIMRGISYTPDYVVFFNKAMIGNLIGIINDEFLSDMNKKEDEKNIYNATLFYSTAKFLDDDDNVAVFFDVKPPYKALKYSNKLGSSREFPIKQRLMYEKFGIIVNKVVPVGDSKSLFVKTFMPKRYLFTDESGAFRKLKSYEKFKPINEYLKK